MQNEDTLVSKKIHKPITLADILTKVQAAGTDPEEPTLEELSQIVREVRQQA